MKSATKIISEFGQMGHPLGRSINRDEVPKLTTMLIQRLGLSKSELDFTPASLKLLENELLDLHQRMDLQSLSEEEIILLVREISAYIGEVMVLHAEGKWESLGTLWSTRVVIEGNIKVTKEGRRRITSSVAYSLGNLGAAALDIVSKGNTPPLYKTYLSAKRKTVKEELKNVRR